MTDRSILERNKAVLWARDVISRQHECLIATAGKPGSECISVSTLDGQPVAQCNLLNNGAVPLEEFTRSLTGKELVAVGLPENLTVLLRGRGIVVHDALHYFGIYANPVAGQPGAGNVPAGEDAARWLSESLTKMAGSSLVLDQADTGTGKWTSAHFKPSPGMIDKLKSFIK